MFRGMRGRLVGATMVVAATGALAACGSSNDNGSSSSSAGAAATATTSAAAAPSGAVTQEMIDFGVTFTGGKAGKADPSLSPVEIGFVNQEGGTPAFPEYASSGQAAVDYVNDYLGGVDGHPVKLKRCIVQSEEDGQKCAAELLSAKVPITVWSLAVAGDSTFFKAVNGKFPILVSVAANSYDNTTPHVYALDGGGLAVLNGMTQDAKARAAKSVAYVGSNNPAGKDSSQKILIPQMKKLGVKNTNVYVADTATTPDMASALQAAGAKNADLVMFNFAGVNGCIAAYDAMKQLGIDKPVSTTSTCGADEMVEHVGNGGPKDWDLFGYTTNPRVTSDPEATLFRTMMDKYGYKKATNVGFVAKTFGDVLTSVKWANAIGADKLTPAAFEAQIAAFTGPAYMVPGTFKCGHDKTLVGVCGDSAIGSRFDGTAWKSLPAVKLVQ